VSLFFTSVCVSKRREKKKKKKICVPERLLEQPKQRPSKTHLSQVLFHAGLLLEQDIWGGLSVPCGYLARMYALNLKQPFNLLAAASTSVSSLPEVINLKHPIIWAAMQLVLLSKARQSQ